MERQDVLMDTQKILNRKQKREKHLLIIKLLMMGRYSYEDILLIIPDDADSDIRDFVELELVHWNFIKGEGLAMDTDYRDATQKMLYNQIQIMENRGGPEAPVPPPEPHKTTVDDIIGNVLFTVLVFPALLVLVVASKAIRLIYSFCSHAYSILKKWQ